MASHSASCLAPGSMRKELHAAWLPPRRSCSIGSSYHARKSKGLADANGLASSCMNSKCSTRSLSVSRLFSANPCAHNASTKAAWSPLAASRNCCATKSESAGSMCLQLPKSTSPMLPVVSL
eukprot:scaffold54132_cov61-Phaeocystis_antarctica.AAC.3